MRHNPTLLLKRLVVTYKGKRVYNETFHNGVNIIRGENSSGKSTITDFIFFALGGDLRSWKREPGLCDSVFAEVHINDAIVSLRRDVEQKGLQPMYIFWGELESALSNAISGWEKYPFSRTEKKNSFSQVLFRSLGMPEVKGVPSSNITMHQILRLIYAAQGSTAAKLFRPEEFDSALTRETVGNLLCGIYDDKLYEYQLEYDILRKDFDSRNQQLKNIFILLGEAGQATTVELIQDKIESLKKERDQLYADLEILKTRPTKEAPSSESDEGLNEIREELVKVNSLLLEKRNEWENLRLDISDSEYFLIELEQRIRSIEDSTKVQEIVGSIAFHFCPSCFSEIKPNMDAESCSLCKEPLDSGNSTAQSLKMKNELDMQRIESTSLLKERKSNYEKLSQEIPKLKDSQNSISLRYQEASKHQALTDTSEIENLVRKIGYSDREIDNYRDNERLYALLDNLREEKARINARITELKDEITTRKESQRKNTAKLYYAVSENIKYLLSHDLDRQDEFKNPESIIFDFGENSVSVDGETRFSESSTVYLKNAFNIALLLASTENSFMRYPRLVILDGIEDGGMEKERSHHFQELIVELSENIEVDHQIIFTTAEIIPKLEDSTFTVGKHYTHDKRSLEMQ